jgi:precorrin-2 dehydrogenase/sirohydrochlorin ferrochelatase
MGYLSLNFQVQDKEIVIIGGGSVAQRKVGNILPAGARLTVISPTITYELQQLRDNGSIKHVPHPYQPGDLAGAFLVIAATNDRSVNRAVAAEAQALGILVEITDNPALGNVTSPAILRQGDLSIAISTNNKAPALAGAIRRELSDLFGPEYAATVRIMGAVREKLLTEGIGTPYNKQIFSELAAQLPPLLAANAREEADALLESHLGSGFTLALLETANEDLP